MTAAAISKSCVPNSPPTTAFADKTKAEHWADLIQLRLRRSVEALLEAGKFLLAAKEQLDHGEWHKLFKRNLISLNEREAQRLMQVARHPFLSKPNSCSLLPPSPQALAVLAQADPVALEQALTAGQISPEMTIVAAKAFRQQHPAPGAKMRQAKQAKEFNHDRSLTRCREVLWGERNKWPTDDLDLLICGLEDIFRDITESVRELQAAQGLTSVKPDHAAGPTNP